MRSKQFAVRRKLLTFFSHTLLTLQQGELYGLGYRKQAFQVN